MNYEQKILTYLEGKETVKQNSKDLGIGLLVLAAALSTLGKKFLAIPGGKNKIMAAMAKHSPFQMQAVMNEKNDEKSLPVCLEY
ncbi:MAG: hypothetical protein KDC85_15715 [Saprospiraceae bacterium]|nr:hypothetical protein [Saprospiraceae bacterium]MCB9326030.1 hypothetical protein [Lewinellaceae bacterium]